MVPNAAKTQPQQHNVIPSSHKTTPSGNSPSTSKLKENARRTLKLSIPKLQMAEQQRTEVRQPRIVAGGETVIQGEVPELPQQTNINDAISAMFLNATTPPQGVKTVSPSSGTNRSPGLNHFMDSNPKQFSRFLSFSPNANFKRGLIESTDLVSNKNMGHYFCICFCSGGAW